MSTNEEKAIKFLNIFAFFPIIILIVSFILAFIQEFIKNISRCKSPNRLCLSSFELIKDWIGYFPYEIGAIPLIIAGVFLLFLFLIKKIPDEKKTLRTLLFYFVFILELIVHIYFILLSWLLFFAYLF